MIGKALVDNSGKLIGVITDIFSFNANDTQNWEKHRKIMRVKHPIYGSAVYYSEHDESYVGKGDFSFDSQTIKQYSLRKYGIDFSNNTYVNLWSSYPTVGAPAVKYDDYIDFDLFDLERIWYPSYGDRADTHEVSYDCDDTEEVSTLFDEQGNSYDGNYDICEKKERLMLFPDEIEADWGIIN